MDRARHNIPRVGKLLMVRGLDAANVAMITSFGNYELKYFRVWTDEIKTAMSDDALLDMLQTRPSGQPLIYPSSSRLA